MYESSKYVYQSKRSKIFFLLNYRYYCHYHILDNLNTDCIIFLSHFNTVLTNAEKNSKYTFIIAVTVATM